MCKLQQFQTTHEVTALLGSPNLASVNLMAVDVDALIESRGLDMRGQGRNEKIATYKAVARLYAGSGFDLEETAFILSKPLTTTAGYLREIKRKLWEPLWQEYFPGMAVPKLCDDKWCISRKQLEDAALAFAEAALKEQASRQTTKLLDGENCLTSDEIHKFVRVVTGTYRVRVRNHILACDQCSINLRKAMRVNCKERETWMYSMFQAHWGAVAALWGAVDKIGEQLPGDPDLARTFATGAFEKAMWALAFDTDDNEPLPWLKRVCVNVGNDWYRDKTADARGYTEISLDEPVGDPNGPVREVADPDMRIDDDVIERNQTSNINDLLDEYLTEEECRLYDLLNVDGKTYQETSDCLNVPLGTVYGRMMRLKLKLLKAMKISRASALIDEECDRVLAKYLTPVEMQIFDFHYVEPLSPEEIGARLGIEPKAVKSAIKRIDAILAAALKDKKLIN